MQGGRGGRVATLCGSAKRGLCITGVRGFRARRRQGHAHGHGKGRQGPRRPARRLRRHRPAPHGRAASRSAAPATVHAVPPGRDARLPRRASTIAEGRVRPATTRTTATRTRRSTWCSGSRTSSRRATRTSSFASRAGARAPRAVARRESARSSRPTSGSGQRAELRLPARRHADRRALAVRAGDLAPRRLVRHRRVAAALSAAATPCSAEPIQVALADGAFRAELADVLRAVRAVGALIDARRRGVLLPALQAAARRTCCGRSRSRGSAACRACGRARRAGAPRLQI